MVVSDATAVWGAGDLIEHGVTGLVYKSGQPAALAGQLTRLLHEPALLARLGEEAWSARPALVPRRSPARWPGPYGECAEGRPALAAMRADEAADAPEDGRRQ